MGGSEQFCGICGTSLETCELDIGPTTGPNCESAKRVRKALINEGLCKRVGQPEPDYDSDEYPEDEEGYYGAEKTYDPEIMAFRDVTLANYDRFLGHVRLVMHDPKIKESSQYFISDDADPGIYGSAEVFGGHPERPNERYSNIMYSTYGDHGNQTKAFPCHGLCLQLAAKAILGNPDSKLLDPETLYRVMCDDFHGGVNGNCEFLSLNHGDIRGAEQYWECIPGYEYCVMNPLEFYALHMETLVRLTVEYKPHGKERSSIGVRNTITDAFQKLSNELVLQVTNYLETKDVFSLCQASMIAREVIGANSFWKRRVQKDMAWLWIPKDLFDDAKLQSEGSEKPPIDWMKVYLLFDSVTARPYAMSGVFMGLANRRRIWTACEQLKSAYVSYAARNGRSLTNPNPSRCTWRLDNEIDLLWKEALDVLQSSEQWLSIRGQAGTTEE